MKIVFDENVPNKLVHGLITLASIASDHDFEITSVNLLHQTGTPDSNVLNLVGKGGILITYDADFKKQRSLYNALKEYQIGLFWVKQTKKVTFWVLVQVMIAHWQEILDISFTEERPFIFEISRQGVERRTF